MKSLLLYIEHTLLKQDARKDEVKKLLDEAVEHEFLGVCVNPVNVKFAKEYYAAHGVAPTFSDCLDYFTGNADLVDLAPNGQITLRPECTDSVFAAYESGEAIGSIAFVDSDPNESDLTFKGYTQDEINRKMAKAEKEQRYHEGLVRHHTYMAKHGLDNADTQYHAHEAEIHQKRANEYKSEALKWKYTKPDKK